MTVRLKQDLKKKRFIVTKTLKPILTRKEGKKIEQD